jgi:outer membrane beta-barrel protein
MKTRFSLFSLLCVVLGSLITQQSIAEEVVIDSEEEVVEETTEAASDEGWIYRPDLSEEDVYAPAIDTENFEISAFTGVISIEDFSSETFYGGRLAYHPLDYLFVEASWATTEINDDNYSRFGVPLFESSTETIDYYDASIGLQLMPGEVFIGKWAFPSSFYLLAGVGSTSFLDEDLETFNFGLGLRVLATDWWSIRVEARDYIFESDLLGEKETKHNLALAIGTGVFF